MQIKIKNNKKKNLKIKSNIGKKNFRTKIKIIYYYEINAI